MLTKLGLCSVRLGRDEAREIGMVLCNTSSLQSLNLACCTLGSTGLEELAPVLYRNTSIKVLDMSDNNLIDMESTEILRFILRRNKTLICLGISSGVRPALLSVLQMGWAATQRYRRLTFQAVPWEMTVFSFWRKLLALGTRRYRSYLSSIMTLHLRALACFSTRWSKAATLQI
jgi:hypothetical protein